MHEIIYMNSQKLDRMDHVNVTPIPIVFLAESMMPNSPASATQLSQQLHTKGVFCMSNLPLLCGTDLRISVIVIPPLFNWRHTRP